ncbi:Regulatory protein abaA [Leucoagaricus sp. SymC.cos]|nr:Regulatory protein abaA [Leucoagaricus sp. SymC.cos]
MSLPVHLPPLSDSTSNKSLTPQRKHRKLLKDGSGAEVWPESIEKIFVQGLHEYWSSPYATYPQSRGRSRWRNQFLVDYLQKHGISRSKKQVASHIQVLRNMWKGEPEYHLVAGGEELADMSPSAGSTIKLEDQWPTGLIAMDFDESTDGYSSNSASPDFSPPDYQQFLPSPDHPTTRQLDMNSGAQYPSGTQNLVPSASPYASSFPNSSQDYSFSGPYDKYGHLSPTSGLTMDTNGSASGYTKSPHHPSRIRVLSLTADGMSPFMIRTDALISATAPYEPLQLKVRLIISTMQDINCPPTLHGFLASICLSDIWRSSAKCITKTIVGNNIVSEDVGSLEVSEINVGTVNAVLPESNLNRCRWLDPHAPTSITQEIVIDDVSLLFVIYELERASGNPMPSAQFMGFLKYPASRSGFGPGSMTTSSSTRPFTISSSAINSANTSGRTFSTSPGHSSTLCGLTAIANAQHSHHRSGAPSSRSAVMAMGNTGANGAASPGGLSAYSLPVHSHHARHPSQSLAHALTPVRYPMATSLPS